MPWRGGFFNLPRTGAVLTCWQHGSRQEHDYYGGNLKVLRDSFRDASAEAAVGGVRRGGTAAISTMPRDAFEGVQVITHGVSMIRDLRGVIEREGVGKAGQADDHRGCGRGAE